MTSVRARPRASHFRAAFGVLAPERREAIRAVYGFCRRADDAVDEAPDADAARARLEAVEQELAALYDGSGRPAEPALAEAISRFGLPRTPFDDLLEGVRWDLEGRRYETVEDLRQYCRRVASTVGLLCVRIFGCAEGRGDAWAEELGVALQWTNILRDVGKDLTRGRVYLPSATLARHGLDEAALVRADAPARSALSRLVAEEAAYARGCFARAESLLPGSERARVLSGRIMGAIYRALLRKVEREGAGVLDREVAVPTAARWAIVARLVLADRVRGRGVA